MATTETTLARDLWPKDHFRRPLLETPFHERIQTQMRGGAWDAWAGHYAARVVEDVQLEYFAIRNACALHDISPLITYRISGAEAESYLNRLTLRDVSKLAAGRVQRTAWCDDDGKVLDDGTLFRLSDTEFRLCCRQRHLPWLLDGLAGAEVAIEDVTRRIAGLALQGPTSFAVMKRAGFADIETLEPSAVRSFPLGSAGVDVLVSRTGITGDLGYEIFVPADQGPALWDILWRAGRLHGLRAAGAAAVDMARIEAGHVLNGRDYISSDRVVRADSRRSPFEIGLGWMVDLDKGHFNGRRALEAESARKSPRRTLAGLDIDGTEPATGSIVFRGRRHAAGIVTSAMWSPTAKRNIALASLEGDHEPGREFRVEIRAAREMDRRSMMVRARVVALPFVQLDRRRATPPDGA